MSWDWHDTEEMVSMRLTREQFDMLSDMMSWVSPMQMLRTDDEIELARSVIERVKEKQTTLFDENHDREALCANPECEHPYYRHFDTYEFMVPVGCKYCECFTFVEQDEKEA